LGKDITKGIPIAREPLGKLRGMPEKICVSGTARKKRKTKRHDLGAIVKWKIHSSGFISEW